MIGTKSDAQPAPAGQNQTAPATGTSGTSANVGSGCNTIAKPPNPGGASVVQPEGESIQHKNWQPSGGEVQFTIKSFEQIPADASIVICFRWKAPSKKDKSYVEAPVSKIDLDSDRKSLKVTTTVPSDLGDQPADIQTAILPFVPLADVRILAINNQTKAAALDATTTIGVTGLLPAVLFTAATIVFGCWVLCVVARRRLKNQDGTAPSGISKASWPLQVISTPGGHASLSQFQIILWTLIVAGSAVYVMSLSGQLIQVTNGTLVLLGIAGAAGLAAKAHSESQDAAAQATAGTAAAEKAQAERIAAEKSRIAAAATAQSDPAAARLQAESDAAASEAQNRADIAAQTKTRAQAMKNPSADQVPKWSDLIVNEITAADGKTKWREVDVTRFQMLLFTLITATFVAMNVLSTYVIPEIPTGFLTLMGISNGVYVGSKVVQRS